jgi:hypothetical protein
VAIAALQAVWAILTSCSLGMTAVFRVLAQAFELVTRAKAPLQPCLEMGNTVNACWEKEFWEEVEEACSL